MPTPKEIAKYTYKVEKQDCMKVPVIVYASPELMKKIQEDDCIRQMQNVACLQGVEKNTIVLPDAHLGYGFCIGGVAAFNKETGIISPGGVGYDINCSVRLVKTNIEKFELEKNQNQISRTLFNKIPTGVGKGGKVKISEKEMQDILKKGAHWAVENGYGKNSDLEFTEETGKMSDADSKAVSQKAISRGINQLGSIGAGNHFLELQYVDEIFDKKTAEIFGIKKGQICFMIHCGSRGLGHQVASDYIKLMEQEYGHEHLPDRQLISAPINSKLGKQYYKAMCSAANFAFCNKQVLTHFTRETLKTFFPNLESEVLYDVSHNMAKFEEHKINNKNKIVCVHRKGATRSFGPGKKELPAPYQKTGQPILIPGSMGTSSYVLVGTKKAEELSFASTPHGAGRTMSRHQAIKTLDTNKIQEQLKESKISVSVGSPKSFIEEAPQAYKNVDEVVKVADTLGIGKLVAKLKPIIVIKG